MQVTEHRNVMAPADMLALREAKRLLEDPGLAIKLTNALGRPLEKGLKLLPEKWSDSVNEVTRKALGAALELAVRSLDKKQSPVSRNRLHKVLATTTGGIGGAFGFTALAVELPVSTTVMLRSIADIARSEGENLKSTEAKLACIEVFALGGSSENDDAAESGYFAVRAALAKLVSEAAEFIAARGLATEGSPVIVRLIAQIAGRFSAAVTEKAAAQAVPAIGAIGGGLINYIFITHFQDMAKGHFTVRRLERKYDPEFVKAEYKKIEV